MRALASPDPKPPPPLIWPTDTPRYGEAIVKCSLHHCQCHVPCSAVPECQLPWNRLPSSCHPSSSDRVVKVIIETSQNGYPKNDKKSSGQPKALSALVKYKQVFQQHLHSGRFAQANLGALQTWTAAGCNT
jgi:hypothetical protein